jgi:hypothetical protein
MTSLKSGIALAAVAFTVLLSSQPAHAIVLNVSGAGESLQLILTTGGTGYNGIGSLNVTNISGTATGAFSGTVSTGFGANPVTVSGPTYTLDGHFIYNDLYYPVSSPKVDYWGLLFTIKDANGVESEWNLWTANNSGAPSGPYILDGYINSGPSAGFTENGLSGLSVTVSAVPEASTWAMILLGFMSVGFLGYRRSRQNTFRVF